MINLLYSGETWQISPQKELANFKLGKLYVPMEAHKQRRQYKRFNLDSFQ